MSKIQSLTLTQMHDEEHLIGEFPYGPEIKRVAFGGTAEIDFVLAQQRRAK